MNRRWISIAMLLLLVAVGLSVAGARAQSQLPGTAFSYQGSLTDNGATAKGAYDFQFRLYSAATAGEPIGEPVSRDDLEVRDGIFVTALDFGARFDGAPRYLEISVRPGASAGAYTTLAPRQELTAAPMALYSGLSAASGSTEAIQGYKVSKSAPANGQLLRWNGTEWAPADGLSYSAGVGLALTGNRFEVRFAGNGSSTAAARSDHNHLGQGWVGDVGYTALWVENRSAVAGAAGVVGKSVNNSGLYGESVGGSGVVGTSRNANGVAGTGFIGVRGESSNIAVYGKGFVGVRGDSPGNVGVVGISGNVGVKGESSGGGGATGLWGVNTGGGWAGFFSGKVHVNGTLSKSAGSFKIDHPLDPANKYLSHSFVESPAMLNIYDGVITLDEAGQAVVELPDYFGALNIDYCYQLTPIGGAAPGLHIAAEVRDNRFSIAGGTPGLKVSWQVTGVRNDAYARDNRIPVEEEKPADERGTYLYPQGFGAPASQGLDAQRVESMALPQSAAQDIPPAPEAPLPPPSQEPR